MDFGIVGMIFDGLTKILMGNLKSIEQTETYLHEVWGCHPYTQQQKSYQQINPNLLIRARANA